MSNEFPYLELAADVRGKVAVFDADTGHVVGYAVIQGAAPENANIMAANGDLLVIRHFVIGHNPRTPPQQARRAIHAAAVAAWKADPAACAAASRDEAKARNITPFMAWVAMYHRTHTP